MTMTLAEINENISKEELTQVFQEVFDVQLEEEKIIEEKKKYFNKRTLNQAQQKELLKQIHQLKKNIIERKETLKNLDILILKKYHNQIDAEL